MKFKVNIENEKEIMDEIKKFAEKDLEVKREVYATALDIQLQAKDNLRALGAIDIRHLSQSILVEPKKDGLEAEVGTEEPYGLYVEFGTRPHFPPPDALEGWARRHGFDSTWPICKAIATHGLPERPYLFPAFFALSGEFYERLRRIFKP